MSATTANYGLTKPDYLADADIAVLNENMEIIDDALGGKAPKSTVTPTTLPASGWTGDAAPYTQTVAVSGITEDSVNDWLPTVDATQEQIEAWDAANIKDGGQSAGSAVLKAWGDKPTVDIPVQVVIGG
jgi:hypothetical protein